MNPGAFRGRVTGLLPWLLLAGCATFDPASANGPPAQDLAATRVDFDPNPAVAGQPVTISYYISNVGSRPIPPRSYEVEVHINDRLVAFDRATKGLEPGQIMDYHFSYKESLKAGDVLHYRLIVDVGGRLAESNEANNTLEGSHRVEAESDQSRILKLLADQAEAWNRGDLDRFLDGYWRSDQTVFAGGGTVHRGFDAMAARYRKSYDTREKMGKLAFSNLTFESIERDRAVVTGSWELQRAADTPGGVFTLILRKLPEGWRIVHDHTSSR